MMHFLSNVSTIPAANNGLARRDGVGLLYAHDERRRREPTFSAKFFGEFWGTVKCACNPQAE
jgi:hypothetical protein